MIWGAAGLLALAVVIVDQPVTLVVSVPEQARRTQTVLLRMEGVVMRRNAPALWNVFWEKQDDAQLVGYVSSPANFALHDSKPANFTLQLPARAMAAARRQT